MRVEVPFGRGDKLADGYVVNVHRTAPPREVKSIARVLDAQVLIPPKLLQLTRWVADYYLCGWGQAAQAVVPAGVREAAGTRQLVFVEAIDAVPDLALS